MKDYVDELEQRLLVMARNVPDDSSARDRPLPGRAARGHWRAISLAAAAALVITLAGLALFAGSSPERAQAFPILSRATTNATGIDIAPELRRNGAKLEQARKIDTPYGAGYVMPTTNGGLCLAVPDPTGGYGQTCASQTDIESRGLALAIVPPDPSEAPQGTGELHSAYVAVLPSGATSPMAHFADGTTRSLDVNDGVATALIRQDATIGYSINGHLTTSRVPAHAAKLGPVIAICDGPHGRYELRSVTSAPRASDPKPCGQDKQVGGP